MSHILSRARLFEDLELQGMLTARPFNGKDWSIELNRSSGCSLQQPYRRYHVLSFFPEQAVKVVRNSRHGCDSAYFGRGELGLYPAGESEHIEWHGRLVEVMHLHIGGDLIERHALNAGIRGRHVKRIFRFQDSELAQYAGALYELCRVWPQDQPAADELINAIGSHIARHYITTSPNAEPVIGRIPIGKVLDSMHGPASASNNLDSLAELTGISKPTFHRLFRRLIGCGPHDYLLRSRLEMSKAQLQTAGRPISSIALDCGFYDQAHYTNAFRQRIGVSPTAFAEWFDTC